MKFDKIISLCLLFTFVMTGKLAGQSPQIILPEGVERVTSVEGITEYRLANGLKVLLFPDQTKPTMTVNITYLVGSAHENYGETGMAHLLEHLTFKGTPKHPNIPQELTAHGASPNGTTWLDRTNYFETFAASDENLNWALELEADRMVNSFIRKSDLDSEMTVVRNEFESGENSSVNVLRKRLTSVAYDWHNYGNSTIGARSDIENVPIERLQAFYKNYYQPDNAVLLVAGKFDEQKTLSLIARYFGKIPRPTRKLPVSYTQEATQDGERVVTLRRVGDTQLVAAAYHIPAGSHPDYAAINILTSVLGDPFAGRLQKALVETKKASSVTGYNFQMRDPGMAFFSAETLKESPLEPVRDIFLQTIDNVGSNPPTKEEVERARAKLLKNIELNLNNSEIIGLELSEWMAMGDWRLFFLNRDRLRKVTVEDVARAAGKYMKPSNRTLGFFIPTPKPDRAEIPQVSSSELAAMLKNYKGDAVIAAGEAFDPSPANIVARTIRSSLPGGLEIALLPKQTRGDTVVVTMSLRFGDEKSLMNQATAGQLAGAMLRRGSTRRTRQQIQDELDKLKARLGIGGGATQTGVFFETVRDNLPAVLRVIAEILREPAFPADEFEQLKREEIANIESQRSEPSAIASNLFKRQTAPHPKGDVRYVQTHAEQVEAVKSATLDDVKNFYKTFYGASNMQIAVVGDFDDKEIARLIGDLFGDWRNPTKFARVESVYKEVESLNKSIETPDKANAFFIAGLNFKARDDSPDYPALILGNYMLGGGFLNSRLATRIRQKEGLSYNVGSNLIASPQDEFGSFMSFAIYAPQNVEKLEAAFKEEIARALKEGFTAEEIADAKKGYLQARQVNRAQDTALASILANYAFIDRTFAWDAEFERRIAALTPEQILAAMRRYIDPAKIIIVKAGNFAKKEQLAPIQ